MPQSEDAKTPQHQQATGDSAANVTGELGTDDLPDPPDWLAEEYARRQHLKQLALSDAPWLPELNEAASPAPDEPDIDR